MTESWSISKRLTSQVVDSNFRYRLKQSSKEWYSDLLGYLKESLFSYNIAELPDEVENNDWERIQAVLKELSGKVEQTDPHTLVVDDWNAILHIMERLTTSLKDWDLSIDELSFISENYFRKPIFAFERSILRSCRLQRVNTNSSNALYNSYQRKLVKAIGLPEVILGNTDLGLHIKKRIQELNDISLLFAESPAARAFGLGKEVTTEVPGLSFVFSESDEFGVELAQLAKNDVGHSALLDIQHNPAAVSRRLVEFATARAPAVGWLKDDFAHDCSILKQNENNVASVKNYLTKLEQCYQVCLATGVLAFQQEESNFASEQNFSDDQAEAIVSQAKKIHGNDDQLEFDQLSSVELPTDDLAKLLGQYNQVHLLSEHKSMLTEDGWDSLKLRRNQLLYNIKTTTGVSEMVVVDGEGNVSLSNQLAPNSQGISDTIDYAKVWEDHREMLFFSGMVIPFVSELEEGESATICRTMAAIYENTQRRQRGEPLEYVDDYRFPDDDQVNASVTRATQCVRKQLHQFYNGISQDNIRGDVISPLIPDNFVQVTTCLRFLYSLLCLVPVRELGQFAYLQGHLARFFDSTASICVTDIKQFVEELTNIHLLGMGDG